MSFFRLPFFLLALLAACAPPGDPRAPVQLMVPPSPSTYLPSAAKHSYSQMVAAALRQRQVDAVADHAHWGDWRLALRVTHSWGSDTATPVFTITDPSGHDLPDVETAPVRFDVWKQARPEILRRAAEEAAPRLATLLREERAARIQRADAQAARDRMAAEARAQEVRAQEARAQEARETARRATAAPSGPTGEPAKTPPANRGAPPPARIVLTHITGAPGNGNQVLSWLLRDKLRAQGQIVQDTAPGADFSVWAKVDDVMVDAQTRRIEIFWHIYNASNQDVGEIVQLNEVPAGSLDRYWGKLAATVTDEAAGGIRDVILTQTGQR